MSRPDIFARAGSAAGPVITLAKAATIVASGGQVAVCAVDPDGKNRPGISARIYGGMVWAPKKPSITWSSLGEASSEQAIAQAACIKAAGEIARRVENNEAQMLFSTIPPWVPAEFGDLDWTGEDICQLAAHRYHLGDVDSTAAWRWAIDEWRANQKIKEGQK